MSALDVFQYAGHEVRTVTIDGEPWFVLADLCRVLELTNPSRVAERVNPDALTTSEVIDSMGRTQNASIVSEPGMYQVIFLSRKDEARQFQWWITHDVLPTIRKTGRYGSDVDMLAALPSSKLLALAAEAAKRAEQAEHELEEARPKVEAYDAFIDADGTYAVGAVAKMLGLSQNKLFDRLRNAGVLIAKGSMRNTPYQQYMHHFTVKATDFERSNGDRGTSYTTRVQPSGVDFVRRKLDITEAVAS